MEILWAFSIYLEAVAILPQLFMLQRTGEAENITTHYLFALGAYRALYVPNWVYRYVLPQLLSLLSLSSQRRLEVSRVPDWKGQRADEDREWRV